MSQALIKNGYQQAKKLLVIQTLIVALVASLGLIKELKVAIALLSGGLAVCLANWFFVYKAFSKSGASANKQVVNAFYIGETLKIGLAVGFISLAFWQLPGFEVFALAGYVVALLSQWLAPIIIKTH
ncbi:ATP synthase subunit I [Aliikangiella sp. G2MR2-5]|uniref:ATP synthase subunit I n=1 Tax=Aliikangiella sp. G2MR2-5 TaxID=2788943 RepID=UPI0018AC8BFC|nr:ATP synthase subunit I [Aliikangiella sp. G2MR2-5]